MSHRVKTEAELESEQKVKNAHAKVLQKLEEANKRVRDIKSQGAMRKIRKYKVQSPFNELDSSQENIDEILGEDGHDYLNMSEVHQT